jgi:sugar/nucleoside kinase (ribokinase family)
MIDIHTCPQIKVHLPAILAETDLFFCNREEAAMLSGKKRGDKEVLLRSLWASAGKPRRPRLFGITEDRGASVLWWQPGLSAEAEYVRITNPFYGRIRVGDLTGAGDAFRAGLIDRLLANPFPWSRGTLTRAIGAAHATAARMIRAPRSRDARGPHA